MIVDAAYTVLFYGLALAIGGLAIAAVITRQLLRAAIALMGLLALSAGLYAMLDAEFLAGIQILVYVGGIVVLIIFAIMLTRSSELLEDHPTLLRCVLGAVASIIFAGSAIYALRTTPFPVRYDAASKVPDVNRIGTALLDYGPNGYVLPFEIISLVLLVAVIGGTVIARKTRPEGQPFTSGGDLPGESSETFILTQRDPIKKDESK